MSAVYPSRYLSSKTIGNSEADLQYLEDPQTIRFQFSQRGDNLQLVAREGERLWHLAHRFYPRNKQAGEFFWLIATYNDIKDPFAALEAGRIYYAPSVRVVTEDMFGITDE